MGLIVKVVSGAQTGVDVAALRAAKSRGVPTGGAVAKGCMTLTGLRPEWVAEFGLTELDSRHYSDRTRANVRDSDLTTRIAKNFRSAGEVCTMRAILASKKPHADVAVRRVGGLLEAVAGDLTRALNLIQAEALRLGRPLVVNFAGNSEQTCPGIEAFAEVLVGALLDAVAR